MQFKTFIPYSIIRLVLVAASFLGALLGSGMHFHGMLDHDHGDDGRHAHSLAAHVHEIPVVVTPGIEVFTPPQHNHEHPVPFIRLLAVPVSHYSALHSGSHGNSWTPDLPQGCFSETALSRLFVFPREPSPPLALCPSDFSSGRSPPSA